MANSNATENIEALAAEIGQNVYIDVANWHLYLADAHLHTDLAKRLYSLVESKSVTEDQVMQVLSEIPVELGGGRLELSLIDLIPEQGRTTLIVTLEEYQRNL